MRGRSSTPSTPVPPQMKAGVYTRPHAVVTAQHECDAEIGPVVSEGGISVEERLSVEVDTPMMSSATNNARSIKVNSPRRTALLKTKNLLKSFGGNGKSNKINGNGSSNSDVSDSKEESLLNTKQSDLVYL